MNKYEEVKCKIIALRTEGKKWKNMSLRFLNI
jgi:hypothetical protein